MADGSRSRRGFLTAVAAVAGATAGCSSIVEEFPGAPSRELVDRFQVDKHWIAIGEWWAHRFVLEGAGTLRYEFSADLPADVFLLTESIYVDEYAVAASNPENDDIPFEYIEGGTLLDVQQGERTVSLEQGRYVIVIDNTQIGPAESEDYPYSDQVTYLWEPKIEGAVYLD